MILVLLGRGAASLGRIGADNLFPFGKAIQDLNIFITVDARLDITVFLRPIRVLHDNIGTIGIRLQGRNRYNQRPRFIGRIDLDTGRHCRQQFVVRIIDIQRDIIIDDTG